VLHRKTDADVWVRNIESDIDRGDFRPIRKGEKLTFKDLVELFTQDKEIGLPAYSPGQQKTMPSMLRFWCEEIGHLRLKSITDETIDDAIAALKEKPTHKERPVSPSTIRKYLSCLGSVYKFARANKLVTKSPLEEVAKPSANDDRVRFLNKEEMATLLTAIDQSRTPELPVAVRLAIHTGLRKAELMGLQWGRVNLRDKPKPYKGAITQFNIPPHHILVEDTKNGEPRFVPMATPALVALKEWGKVVPINTNALVFPSRETASKPLDIRKPWETALKKSGITNFRWHDLRHTFASHMVMTGANHIEIARLTGHKDMKSLQRYSHLSPEHAAHLVNKMAENLEGN
jgi:integrase